MRRRVSPVAAPKSRTVQSGWVNQSEKLRREVLHPVVLGHALADVFVEVRSDVLVKTQLLASVVMPVSASISAFMPTAQLSIRKLDEVSIYANF